MKRFEKKAIRCMAVMVIMIGMMFTVSKITSITAQAAPNYKKLYGKVLTKNKIWFVGENRTIENFALVDINGDGVKELIGTANYRIAHVYTIKNGKVKRLAEVYCFISCDQKGAYVQYNKKYKGLVLHQHGGTGLSGHELYKIKNGKLKCIVAIQASYMPEKTYYSPNKSTYKKYFNKYFKESSLKKIYMNNNTSYNRSKKLK